MGRGRSLTSKEKSIIRALHGEKSYQQIADTLKRSKNAVYNYLQSLKVPKKNNKIGRPPSLTSTLKRAIVRRARTGRFNARDLKEMFNAPVSVRGVQQVLQGAEYLEYSKKKTAPKLTALHKKQEWPGQ